MRVFVAARAVRPHARHDVDHVVAALFARENRIVLIQRSLKLLRDLRRVGLALAGEIIGQVPERLADRRIDRKKRALRLHDLEDFFGQSLLLGIAAKGGLIAHPRFSSAITRSRRMSR